MTDFKKGRKVVGLLQKVERMAAIKEKKTIDLKNVDLAKLASKSKLDPDSQGLVKILGSLFVAFVYVYQIPIIRSWCKEKDKELETMSYQERLKFISDEKRKIELDSLYSKNPGLFNNMDYVKFYKAWLKLQMEYLKDNESNIRRYSSPLKPNTDTSFDPQGNEGQLVDMELVSEQIQLIDINFLPEQSSQIIKLIYSNLNNELFQIVFSRFERHFIGNSIALAKIKWTGTEAEIAHLFKWLSVKSIIITDKPYVVIVNHFINKKGRNFKPNNLGVAKSKLNLDNYPRIQALTERLNKLILTFN